MKQPILLFILASLFTSCYQTLSLDGFERDEWQQFNSNCTDYRLEIVDHLIQNQHVLLESNQNEIESLLGAATEHELYERNQKFFHYQLTPADSCGTFDSKKFLSIRFNAIGRANEVMVVVRE